MLEYTEHKRIRRCFLMSKTITLRLSEEEYKKIASASEIETPDF